MSESGSAGNRRRAALWVPAAVAVVAVVILAGWLLRSTPGAVATPSESPAAAGEPAGPTSPTAVAAASEQPGGSASPGLDAASARDAEAALRAYLRIADEAMQRADGTAPGLEGVATGPALGEVQARADQSKAEGRRQVGFTQVVAVEASSASGNAAGSVTLAACLDTTGVDTVDRSGIPSRGGCTTPADPSCTSTK